MIPLHPPILSGEGPDRLSPRATKRINTREAENLISTVAFAHEICTPTNAHATIQRVGISIGDDPDGSLFARVREGFDEWLNRQDIPGGLTCLWMRERLTGASAEVVHCHMLFHLAHPFQHGKNWLQVTRALERLIDRLGCGNNADYTLS